MSFRIDDTPAANGDPLFRAGFKQQPADFLVSELLEIEFDQAGEHLYLQVEKTAMNTDELVSLLEKECSVASTDVGIAGLKDRHAVTTQWVSVRTTAGAAEIESVFRQFNENQQPDSFESREGDRRAQNQEPVNLQNDETLIVRKHLKLISSARHSRKLRRGAHRGNRFVITLRNVCALPENFSTGAGAGAGAGADADADADADAGAGAGKAKLDLPLTESGRFAVDQRIQQIRALGFPNYIGPQRFGFGGQNLVRARQWFRQPKKRASRQQRSLWLSASRSIIFNTVCAARVRDQSWSRLLNGEPAVLDGSRSFFHPDSEREADDVVALQSRLDEFDIHPSAPWWGRGKPEVSGECEQYE
ncbi:MAG: tRNA pseudouridine(13) synthase TruD, partial [Granulosicoccus sp.]